MKRQSFGIALGYGFVIRGNDSNHASPRRALASWRARESERETDRGIHALSPVVAANETITRSYAGYSSFHW
jgi:hypothetical protein